MPKAMSKNDVEIIKNSISRYLSMREHSKLELEKKLLKKYFEKDLILQCINEFSEKDLQSDYRYAESFVRSKFNDHKGENFIRSVVWEFPSYKKAVECHQSKEYQAEWALAKKTTARHMQIIEGFSTE